jgi:hypothetical protein
MADLDLLAPNYRRARERWPDAPTLSRCYEALTTCFDGNAHGMVEHVKSFIECVCITILAEFGEPKPPSNPTATVLLRAALRPLGFQNTKGASKLDKVLSGFNTLTDALTEMRNDQGAVAHGKDAFLDAVTADHARAFLHAGDAILSVLLNALEGKEPNLTATREPYQNFAPLNDRIDRAVSVKVRVDDEGDRPIVVFAVATGPADEAIEIRVEPSKLLYGTDRSAYVEVLRTATAFVVEPADEGREAPREEGEPSDLRRAPTSPPTAEVVQSYTGRLAALRPALEDLLKAEVLRSAEGPADAPNLADSLLATADHNMGLDWKQREALQARLKVACKRVLVQFGFDGEKAERGSTRVVEWMRSQVPDPDSEHQGQPE